MKMSRVFRFASQIVFWCAIALFLRWLFVVEEPIWRVLLMMVLTVVGTNFARIVKNKLLTFLCHLMVAAVPGFFAVLDWIPVTAMFFGIVVVVLSLLASWAEVDFMDKGHGFGQFVLLAIYIVGSIMEYDLLWFHFGFFVIYTFLIFIEINVSENEEYIHGVSYTSVVDVKKMHKVANLVTLIISLMMLVVTVAFAFIGQIGPVARLGSFITAKLRDLLSFLKRINIGSTGGGEVEETPSAGYEGEDIFGGSEDPITQEELPTTALDRVVWIVLIAVVILALGYSIFAILRKIYRYYLSQQQNGDVDEQQFTIAKRASKKSTDPSKEDASYNNRKAVRKIYKKKVRGKSRRREDFYNYTPSEQRDKSVAEGNEVGKEVVEIYEKARYSKESITKDDVRKIKK